MRDSSLAVVVSTQPTAPQVASNSPICAEQTLSFTVSGVYPPGATYSWTGPNNFTASVQNPTIPNIGAIHQGLYQVYVMVNGCQSAPSLHQVTVLPVPQMSVTPASSVLCIGQSVTMSASGANFGYSWVGPNLNVSNGQIVTATPTQTSTYYVYGTNTNQGCPDIDTVTITVNEPLAAVAGADQPDLCGSTAQLSATDNGGVGQWTVVSGTGGSFSSPDSANAVFSGQPGTSYTLAWTVTNAPCAAATDSVEVSFLDAVQAPTALGDAACLPDSATVTLTATAPAGYTINWYADTTQAPVATGESYSPAITQTSTYYVAAGNGICQSEFIPVEAIADSIPAVEAGLSVQVDIGQTVQLLATGTPGVSYSWSPGANLLGSNTATPTALPGETTTYTVTVTTANGCTASDTVRVGVVPLLVIPNGFTPNGDGQNDVWELEAITEGYPDARIEVFNRWGGIVFTSRGYAKPWDGTLDGEDLPTSTYYYIIYLQAGQPPLSGSVTIIR